MCMQVYVRLIINTIINITIDESKIFVLHISAATNVLIREFAVFVLFM